MLNIENAAVNLLNKVYEISVRMLDLVESGNWPEFSDQLNVRQELLIQFKELMNDNKRNTGNVPKNNLQKNEVMAQFEKIAKVNDKIYDIIISKKDGLMSEIVRINKGLEFLRQYEKNVNGSRILSRTY